jgi:hypothetical protein
VTLWDLPGFLIGALAHVFSLDGDARYHGRPMGSRLILISLTEMTHSIVDPSHIMGTSLIIVRWHRPVFFFQGPARSVQGHLHIFACFCQFFLPVSGQSVGHRRVNVHTYTQTPIVHYCHSHRFIVHYFLR